ncbi:MAG: hypothetical protein KY476_24315, partial [Planctomycetes bacterium]|nr:hypothetical protein [Planctomycetota bacterium]
MADVDEFAADAAGFLDQPPSVFPAWETRPAEHDAADPVFGGRLRVLDELATPPCPPLSKGGREQGRAERRQPPGPPRIVVTSIQALLQPVPSRADREAATRTLTVGDELDPEELMRWLLERGFDRVPALEAPGEFAMHGGILDVFPADAIDPLRLEFFGDEIESIRRFDVETQRKVEELRQCRLTLVRPVEAAPPSAAPPLTKGGPGGVAEDGKSPPGTARAGRP